MHVGTTVQHTVPATLIGGDAYQSFCGSSSDSIHGGGPKQVHGLLHMVLCDIHLELHAR